MQLRWNRPVRHGLHITPDGGQRGTEIMGDVCYDFLLVFFHVPKLDGHVIQ